MAGILEYLPQLNKRAWKFILILVAVVLLIIAIHYVWKNYVSPKLNPTYVANKEYIDNTQEDKEAELLIFTVDWCPYCKKAEPVWDSFAEENNGAVIGGYKMIFEKINCTDEDNADVKSMQNQFNIEGYPTIKLVKDNEIIEYDAKPDKETLQQFLQTVLT